jgi:hypothetical protein
MKKIGHRSAGKSPRANNGDPVLPVPRMSATPNKTRTMLTTVMTQKSTAFLTGLRTPPLLARLLVIFCP